VKDKPETGLIINAILISTVRFFYCTDRTEL
jgi:hypothetical protein